MQTLSRKAMVAGNWKMNGDLKLAEQFSKELKQADFEAVDVLICPPFPLLTGFSLADFALGAQTCSESEPGAHTGETSAQLLRGLDCGYVILGHSERRADQQESNQLVAKKVSRALSEGLTPILCVGEPLEIREQGQLFEYLQAQLDAVLDEIGIKAFQGVVIAYEPVWAIGTGKTASPEQAQEVHAFIRQHMGKADVEIANKVRILYGGSVKGENAEELFSQPDVDGGLIGGASLKIDEFKQICQAANALR